MGGGWHLGCSFTGEIAKEAAMCTKWTRTSLLIAMLAAAPVAWADGSQTTAKANAFGQNSATHSQ
jgi:hypothetical protein